MSVDGCWVAPSKIIIILHEQKPFDPDEEHTEKGRQVEWEIGIRQFCSCQTVLDLPQEGEEVLASSEIRTRINIVTRFGLAFMFEARMIWRFEKEGTPNIPLHGPSSSFALVDCLHPSPLPKPPLPHPSTQ